ncbi:reverse transcriptase [Plakobranchus ocellatus]|uniref:Reverse transcriptase n=1 Tax=Plakobranchus ocellatus TaxID=259542 RepID=A0AAV3YE84_9GAST|nr:reverse transcriptase [Plakobranchus ocellatus]
MDVILRAADWVASPADVGDGCYMPSLRTFMDDNTILCSKEIVIRRVIVQLDALINWNRISFKLKKSRSLSITKGKLDEDVCFIVTNQDIPRINLEPIKSLRRWYDSSLKDSKCRSEVLEQSFRGSASYRQVWLARRVQSVLLPVYNYPKALVATSSI